MEIRKQHPGNSIKILIKQKRNALKQFLERGYIFTDGGNKFHQNTESGNSDKVVDILASNASLWLIPSLTKSNNNKQMGILR
jgi:hypothetical protein